jgi:citronellyl-CoA dehydrogenase
LSSPQPVATSSAKSAAAFATVPVEAERGSERDVLFTEEHDQLRKTVRDFIAKEINPYVEEWERNPPFPARELFPKLGKLGLLGVTKPEKYGGMGLDYSYGLVVSEELGSVHCGGVPMGIGVQTDMCTPALANYGSDELREEFLRPAIAGEMIGCIGVSETGGGSDVAALKTTARADGDDYVINGSKMWITNATQADFMCLLANTGDGPAHKNKSLMIVPMNSKGITLSDKLDKLGMRSSDTAQVFFEDVRIPQRYRIGAEGMGFMMQMLQFQEERMFAAVNSLRGMEHVIDATIEYCKGRETFGQPLIDNQVIHFRMGELMTEVEALRALIYRACEQYVNGTNVTMLASMAKLKSGRLMREVADACLQYWGGMGFMWDNPASQLYRDGRLLSIGGGADEIMLGIICKLMGILPSKKKG